MPTVRALRALAMSMALVFPCGAGLAQEAAPAALSLEQAWGRHERAVVAARAGDTLRAVAELESLAQAFPRIERFAQDWIVVLTWLGRDAEALALLSRIGPDTAPVYVLEALAGAARRTGDLSRARDFLTQAVARFPDQVSTRMALGWALFDLGQVPEGQAVLDGLPPGRDRSLARARYAEARGEWTAALALWSDLLAANPDDREANIGMVGAARRLGAVHVADEIIQKHPDWFEAAERLDVLAERVAQDLRWSLTAVAQGSGSARFAELDRALAASDALESRLRAGAQRFEEGEWRMLLDRCAMLVERFRMQDALELHALLSDRLPTRNGRAMPAYVEAAAGEALLYLDRPAEAEPRFRRALAAGATEARFGLFYALEDAGRHEDALQWIDGLVLSLRPVADGSPIDPDWIRARVLSASIRSWHNNPEHAERALRELLDERPGDVGVRQALAEVLRARGWPREALQLYDALVAEEPEGFGVRVDRAEILLGLNDWAQTRRELDTLIARRPEDRQVQKLAESWARSQAPELTVDFVAGSGSGSSNAPLGSRDWALESRFHTAPFEGNWRAFVHQRLAEGFLNGVGSRVERVGTGLDYRAPDLRGSLLLDASPLDDQSPGVSGNLRWWADDRLWAGAALSTRVVDLPVQARLAGVHATRVGVDAGLQVNEQRSFSLGAARLQYSDTNERQIVTAAWDERLLAGPRARLDFRLSLWQSTNTLTNAAYFNPAHDFAPTATVAAEWTSWRVPGRSFSQRVSAGGGRYFQAGMSSGPVWELQYEHTWDWNGWQSLRYGVGRSLHPYDGVQASRNFMNASLVVRF